MDPEPTGADPGPTISIYMPNNTVIVAFTESKRIMLEYIEVVTL